MFGVYLIMERQSIIKINDFNQILNELIYSYGEYAKKYHSQITDDTLGDEWLKEELHKHDLKDYEEFYPNAISALEQFKLLEKEVCVVMGKGINSSAWLYSLLRPDFNSKDDNDEYIDAMQKLYDIYNQSCMARYIIQNALPSIKAIPKGGHKDNQDNVDDNLAGNKECVIDNQITDDNKHAIRQNYQINPQVANSVHKALLQQYSQKMQLDISYNMTVGEMSICAMDDIAYHLSKNAALMGTGSLALSVGMCLGQSYFESRKLGFDNKMITEALLRPGAKSGLRVALIGALKIGAARNALPIISSVASSGALLGVATVGVECCDAMIQYAQRRIDAWQAIDQVGRASTTGICSLALGAQGAAIGASAVGMISVMPIVAPILGSTIALPIMGELIGGGTGIFVGSLAGKEVYEHTRRLAIFSENIAVDAIKAEKLWEQSKNIVRKLRNKVKVASIEI